MFFGLSAGTIIILTIVRSAVYITEVPHVQPHVHALVPTGTLARTALDTVVDGNRVYDDYVYNHLQVYLGPAARVVTPFATTVFAAVGGFGALELSYAASELVLYKSTRWTVTSTVSLCSLPTPLLLSDRNKQFCNLANLYKGKAILTQSNAVQDSVPDITDLSEDDLDIIRNIPSTQRDIIGKLKASKDTWRACVVAFYEFQFFVWRHAALVAGAFAICWTWIFHRSIVVAVYYTIGIVIFAYGGTVRGSLMAIVLPWPSFTYVLTEHFAGESLHLLLAVQSFYIIVGTLQLLVRDIRWFETLKCVPWSLYWFGANFAIKQAAMLDKVNGTEHHVAIVITISIATVAVYAAFAGILQSKVYEDSPYGVRTITRRHLLPNWILRFNNKRAYYSLEAAMPGSCSANYGALAGIADIMYRGTVVGKTFPIEGKYLLTGHVLTMNEWVEGSPTDQFSIRHQTEGIAPLVIMKKIEMSSEFMAPTYYVLDVPEGWNSKNMQRAKNPYDTSMIQVSDGKVMSLGMVDFTTTPFTHFASTSPGWSGAPVCNMQGRVVGVHEGTVSARTSSNFFIPLPPSGSMSVTKKQYQEWLGMQLAKAFLRNGPQITDDDEDLDDALMEINDNDQIDHLPRYVPAKEDVELEGGFARMKKIGKKKNASKRAPRFKCFTDEEYDYLLSEGFSHEELKAIAYYKNEYDEGEYTVNPAKHPRMFIPECAVLPYEEGNPCDRTEWKRIREHIIDTAYLSGKIIPEHVPFDHWSKARQSDLEDYAAVTLENSTSPPAMPSTTPKKTLPKNEKGTGPTSDPQVPVGVSTKTVKLEAQSKSQSEPSGKDGWTKVKPNKKGKNLSFSKLKERKEKARAAREEEEAMEDTTPSSSHAGAN